MCFLFDLLQFSFKCLVKADHKENVGERKIHDPWAPIDEENFRNPMGLSFYTEEFNTFV